MAAPTAGSGAYPFVAQNRLVVPFLVVELTVAATRNSAATVGLEIPQANRSRMRRKRQLNKSRCLQVDRRGLLRWKPIK